MKTPPALLLRNIVAERQRRFSYTGENALVIIIPRLFSVCQSGTEYYFSGCVNPALRAVLMCVNPALRAALMCVNPALRTVFMCVNPALCTVFVCVNPALHAPETLLIY